MDKGQSICQSVNQLKKKDRVTVIDLINLEYTNRGLHLAMIRPHTLSTTSMNSIVSILRGSACDASFPRYLLIAKDIIAGEIVLPIVVLQPHQVTGSTA